MLSPEEKQALRSQIDELQKEIKELRQKLNVDSKEKEALFSQKEKIGREIRSLISQAKSGRGERDTLTKEVSKLKEKRKELNKKIKDKIKEHKDLIVQKNELAKKTGVKGDPGRIKREISKLDYRIETEGLSFANEQKLMKQIKELQKKIQ